MPTESASLMGLGGPSKRLMKTSIAAVCSSRHFSSSATEPRRSTFAPVLFGAQDLANAGFARRVGSSGDHETRAASCPVFPDEAREPPDCEVDALLVNVVAAEEDNRRGRARIRRGDHVGVVGAQ